MKESQKILRNAMCKSLKVHHFSLSEFSIFTMSQIDGSNQLDNNLCVDRSRFLHIPRRRTGFNYLNSNSSLHSMQNSLCENFFEVILIPSNCEKYF